MFEVLVLVITCFVNLALGGLVFARNTKSIIGRTFFCVTLFIACWAVSNHLTNQHFSSLGYNNTFNKLAFLSGYLAILAAVWFSYNFPVRQKISNKAKIFVYGTAAVTSVLSFTDWVAGVVTIQDGELHFSIGSLLSLYVASATIFLLLIARNMRMAIHHHRGRQREQVSYVVFGFVMTAMLGLLTNAVIPGITADWKTAALGPLSTIFLVSSIAYAMVRHRLFDLRLAVVRSLAYALSIVVVTTGYIITAFGLSSIVFGLHLKLNQEIFLAVFSGFAAVTFQPLKKFFDKLTNRLFYRDAYDPQELFNRLNKILVTTADLNKLLNSVITAISESLKSEYFMVTLMTADGRPSHMVSTTNKKFSAEDMKVAHSRSLHNKSHSTVIVTDDLDYDDVTLRKVLDKNDIAVLVQLGAQDSGHAMGHLIIGPKKSGNPYTTQDVNVIETIANELVIAIQNALRFEEIERFNETLQQKVEDATRKLRRTNEKLRQLDETKDDFISMASHQLRTPLTSVKGYVSMVIDGDAGSLTPLQKKLLNQSFISAQRMVYLISDLLNVSRLRTGKFVIEPIQCDLAKMIQEEVKQLVETAKGRGLELVYHKPEHFPVLLLDETKMRQVIMNFIDNAIYYTQAGGTITINLSETPQSIEFTVVDNGIGVPKAEQHHLFSKFFRAHNAKRARPDGTGLGLFMAKKVIVAQGGAIIFKSQEGKGSTFGFSFAKKRLTVVNTDATPEKQLTK